MQFSLRWLLLFMTAVCVVLAWCSHFGLSPAYVVPTSVVGIGGATLSMASLLLRGELRLGVAATAVLLLIFDAVYLLYSMFFDSSMGTLHGCDWVMDEVKLMSAAVVVTPALGLFPVAISICHAPLSPGSRWVVWAIAIAWITLMLHIIIVHCYWQYQISGI